MVDRSEFKAFADSRGGVFSTAELARIPHLESFFTREQEFAQFEGRYNADCKLAGSNRTIQIGYVYSTSFDAVATSRNDIDIIAIHAGVPLRLANVIHAFVDHMPDIGSQDARALPVMTEDEALFGDVDLFNLPELPERGRLIYDAIMAYAESFILEHELAHIVNGHLDWLNTKDGNKSISELGMSNRVGISSLDIQTMEWNADCAATWVVVNHALELDKGSKLDEVHLVAIAMFIVAKMFGPETHIMSEEEIVARDHPPGYIRLTNMFAYARSFITPDGRGAGHGIDRVAAIWVTAEKHWAKIFGVDFVHYGDDALMSPGSKLIKKITDNWKILRPEFDKLKRYGTLIEIIGKKGTT